MLPPRCGQPGERGQSAGRRDRRVNRSIPLAGETAKKTAAVSIRSTGAERKLAALRDPEARRYGHQRSCHPEVSRGRVRRHPGKVPEHTKGGRGSPVVSSRERAEIT